MQMRSPSASVALVRIRWPATSTPLADCKSVPGVSNSVIVNGVSGEKLVLVATAGCGPGTSLLAYDPAANTFSTLLGPTVNGGSVTQAIVFPGRK